MKSLLENFGLQPLAKMGRGKNSPNSGKTYMTVRIATGKKTNTYYSLSISSIGDKRKEWEFVDIAFSQQHGGLFVAKGSTFKLQKGLFRIDSKPVFEAIWQGYSLKWPKHKAKVFFSVEPFSTDVYLLKLEGIAYIE